MHNNFFFLRHLSSALKEKLVDSRLLECFSQNKDELVIVFLMPDNTFFYLLANLGTEFSCLSFPKEFNKAKRNTATIFPELTGAVVKNVVQKDNERSFSMHFHNGASLLFKLFGNRGNIILYLHKQLISIFKNQLRADKTIDPDLLNRQLDLSLENFTRHDWKLKPVIYTLGPVGEKYIEQKGYFEKPELERYQLVLDILRETETPHFHITRLDEAIVLSVFPIGLIQQSGTDPIEAINLFYAAHYRFNYLENQKAKLKNKIEIAVSGTMAYLEKIKKRLEEINTAVPYGQMADILMANMHVVPKGSEKITLFDFYRNSPLEIKLKKELSPQKNAEQLYHKEKNRHIEVDTLVKQIKGKENVLERLLEDVERIGEISDFRKLEILQGAYEAVPQETTKTALKFKTFDFEGFNIFVGRNAGNNDELTQKFAHKDDLWLHAKDVSGSHVVIRHQAGKNFPKTVIEKAASVAAFYSRRKNESLCPVIFTLKKYVRKVKGAPKGAVKIEKEKVLMVVPADF